MDFHSLPRRDLQALCKMNRIPANMTNIAMADALQALEKVEGIGEAQEASQFQSPMKDEVRLPELPRTCRRTSARRGCVQEETKERQGSPLPRARRVTAKASEIVRMVDEEEEGVKQEGPGNMLETPKAPNTRRRVNKKEEREEVTLSTRRRAIRKEEKEENEGTVEIQDTPATRNGRRASVRRVSATPKAEIAKEEKTVTCRRTRQSSRKEMEEVKMDSVGNTGRRSTRGKAAVVKMAALAREEVPEREKDVAEDVHCGEVSGKKSTDLLMDEETVLMETKQVIFSRYVVVETEGSDGSLHPTVDGDDDLAEVKENDATEDNSKSEEDRDLEMECSDAKIQEILCSAPEKENQIIADQGISKDDPKEEDGREVQEQDLGDPRMSGFEESPIRGLISSEILQEEEQKQDAHLTNPISHIITETERCDETTEENGTETDGRSSPDKEEEEKRREGSGLDFYVQQTPMSDNTQADIEDSNYQLRANQLPDGSPFQQAYDEPPEENGTATDLRSSPDQEEEEGKEVVDLDFHPQETPLSDSTQADIEASGYELLVNHLPDGSPFQQADVVIAEDASIDCSGEIPGTVELNFHPLETPLSDGTQADIEDSGYQLLVNNLPDDSPRQQADVAISADARIDCSGEFPATSDQISLASEVPALLLTGEILDAGVDLPVNSHASLGIPASLDPTPIKFPAESSVSGDILTGQIPADMEESGSDNTFDDLTNSTMEVTEESDESLLISSQITAACKVHSGSPTKTPDEISDQSGEGFDETSAEGNTARSAGMHIDDKENMTSFGLTELTEPVEGAEGGVMKVQIAAEKQSLKVDLNAMSLRKLKNLYKEKANNNNNNNLKVEEKRCALKDLNENCM